MLRLSRTRRGDACCFSACVVDRLRTNQDTVTKKNSGDQEKTILRHQTAQILPCCCAPSHLLLRQVWQCCHACNRILKKCGADGKCASRLQGSQSTLPWAYPASGRVAVALPPLNSASVSNPSRIRIISIEYFPRPPAASPKGCGWVFADTIASRPSQYAITTSPEWSLSNGGYHQATVSQTAWHGNVSQWGERSECGGVMSAKWVISLFATFCFPSTAKRWVTPRSSERLCKKHFQQLLHPQGTLTHARPEEFYCNSHLWTLFLESYTRLTTICTITRSSYLPSNTCVFFNR